MCPIAEFVELHPNMYYLEALPNNNAVTTERFDKHRSTRIQGPAAERLVQQQYLDQLDNQTDNLALNGRLASRIHQI